MGGKKHMTYGILGLVEWTGWTGMDLVEWTLWNGPEWTAQTTTLHWGYMYSGFLCKQTIACEGWWLDGWVLNNR